MLKTLGLVLLSAAFLVACSSDDSPGNPVITPDAKVIDGAVSSLPDACVANGTTTFTQTGPDQFVCHDMYRSTFALTNGSCSTITVTGITLAATVKSVTPEGATCTPPGSFTYTNLPMPTVAPGQTVTVLDLTGNAFCCFQQACPVDFSCVETFTFVAHTSAGDFTATPLDTTISLPSCDTICPQ